MKTQLRQIKFQIREVTRRLVVMGSQMNLASMITRLLNMYSHMITKDYFIRMESFKEDIEKTKNILETKKSELPEDLYNEIVGLLDIFEAYVVIEELCGEVQ